MDMSFIVMISIGTILASLLLYHSSGQNNFWMSLLFLSILNIYITTFINTNEPRRKELLDNIKSNNLPHHNINTCFDKNQLQAIYNSTKIMINIHQTDHHHTFEELRVLPALLCGVIVVCEESPLIEHIPYKDYVIWCKYNEVVDLTKHIMDNYTRYYELLFSETKINNLHNIIETSIWGKLRTKRGRGIMKSKRRHSQKRQHLLRIRHGGLPKQWCQDGVKPLPGAYPNRLAGICGCLP
jgi:hypothetical protein